MVRSLLVCTFLILLGTCGYAQSEIDWTVKINTDQITQTDKRIFNELESQIVRFLDGIFWTKDRFLPEERVEATIFLTISEVFEESNKGGGASVVVPDVYKATVAVQSSRPIYGTTEKTPVFNFQDRFVQFQYQRGEGIQYSEQTYTGDLANILAFYSYMILGFDYDTFSPRGGEELFKKAQDLYNRLPTEIQNTQGWRSGNKSRNRYWLLENVLEGRMLVLRRAYYTYHRLGLDMMTTDVAAARANITLAIEDAVKANQAYPNTMYAQAFVDAKREEIVEIYKGATGPEQNTVISAMSRLDPSKASTYRNIRFTGGRRPSVSRAPVRRNTRGKR